MFHTQFRPEQIHPSVFIGPGAVIVGDVTLAEDASVWFNATLRGDTDPLVLAPAPIFRKALFCTPTPATPLTLERALPWATVRWYTALRWGQIHSSASGRFC